MMRLPDYHGQQIKRPSVRVRGAHPVGDSLPGDDRENEVLKWSVDDLRTDATKTHIQAKKRKGKKNIVICSPMLKVT